VLSVLLEVWVANRLFSVTLLSMHACGNLINSFPFLQLKQ